MIRPRDKALEAELLKISDRYHATQDPAARARLRAQYRDLHARWVGGGP